MKDVKDFASKDLTQRSSSEASRSLRGNKNYFRIGGKIAMEFAYEVKSPIQLFVEWIRRRFGNETDRDT